MRSQLSAICHRHYRANVRRAARIALALDIAHMLFSALSVGVFLYAVLILLSALRGV